MNDIESLHRLTETVETAGADIAPTYIEYVQLAFAIATDCGEAGRDYFHRLCRLSAKYQREHAERVFTNALATHHGDVHLGTVFHLAETAGVTVFKDNGFKDDGFRDNSFKDNTFRNDVMNSPPDPTSPTGKKCKKGSKGTENSGPDFFTHTCARYKVENDESRDGGEKGDEDEKEEKEEELLPGSEPKQQLPTFAKYQWPGVIQRIISYGKSDALQDLMLLGALTALGATIALHLRCPYAGKFLHPCLQFFGIAPSASGKGILSYIRLLVMPIHNEIRADVAAKMKIYKKEKAVYDSLGKERAKREVPQMPANRMFLISGNNTGTGILQNIMDSDGQGFICEAEADTLSTAINAEHGQWSTTLRKAFDHDSLSYNRRTNQEYREIMKSYLSLCVSGTPSQVKSFIPTTEDGAFSREVFYYLYGIEEWKDQFLEEDLNLEEVFTNMGLDWKKEVERIKAHGLHTLRLTDNQKREFNACFSELFTRSSIANGREMYSSIARLAINLCRIMSVVALLRALESPRPYDFRESPSSGLTPEASIPADNLKDNIITRWNLSITADDFHAVLSLAEPLYRHATHILSFLPSTEISRRSNADRDFLFSQLGDKFTRAELLDKAAAIGIKKNTAITWLKRLTRRGLLIKAEDIGLYVRAHVRV